MLASIRPPAVTPFPSAEAHPLDRPGQAAIQAGLRLPSGQAGGQGDAGLTALRVIRRPRQMPDLLPGGAGQVANPLRGVQNGGLVGAAEPVPWRKRAAVAGEVARETARAPSEPVVIWRTRGNPRALGKRQGCGEVLVTATSARPGCHWPRNLSLASVGRDAARPGA